MINEVNGDILDIETEVIIQQVNCQGVMGSGLAKQIRNKYPVVYKKYKELCSRHKPKELLGKVQVIKVEDNKFVTNIFGQLNYGRDKNTMYTCYEAFERALNHISERLEVSSIESISFPKNIGCGLANGDWDVIYPMIKRMDNSCLKINIVNYVEYETGFEVNKLFDKLSQGNKTEKEDIC